MSTLEDRLERLGLSQYLHVLVTEGFDTWDTVLDITESDLSSLNVKLGHRRKLQRAIAESRGQHVERPLPIVLGKPAVVDGSYRSDESGTESKLRLTNVPNAHPTSSAKRKYRRHPRPDEHAPERPPSAYVIFSNQVRETLRGQELSFTEIAKVVGERWQVLPADAREAYERQANAAKEKYYTELAEYKKTSQYDAYQKYLEDFKAKHAPVSKESEGKRSRVELSEASSSALGGSAEVGDCATNRRASSHYIELAPSHRRSGSDPPPGPGRLPAAPSYPSLPSKSTSPVRHSMSGYSSPQLNEQYSPASMSPLSSSLRKEGSLESPFAAISRENRLPHDSALPFLASSLGHSQAPLRIGTSTASVYTSHFSTSVESLSRRPMREPSHLPPLTHEDTTLSSDSGGMSTQSSFHTGHLLPVLEAPKSLRVLPAPIPTAPPAAASPLDRLPPPNAPSLHQQPTMSPDYRTTSSLAALLRASELARVADDEEMAG